MNIIMDALKIPAAKQLDILKKNQSEDVQAKQRWLLADLGKKNSGSSSEGPHVHGLKK